MSYVCIFFFFFNYTVSIHVEETALNLFSFYINSFRVLVLRATAPLYKKKKNEEKRRNNGESIGFRSFLPPQSSTFLHFFS